MEPGTHPPSVSKYAPPRANRPAAKPPRMVPPPVPEDYDVAIDLYKTYMSTFLQALGFYIAINGGLLTAAFSKSELRTPLTLAAFGLAAVALPPLGYAMHHARKLRRRIIRIARSVGRNPIDAQPLSMLLNFSGLFWLFITAGWVAVLLIPLR